MTTCWKNNPNALETPPENALVSDNGQARKALFLKPMRQETRRKPVRRAPSERSKWKVYLFFVGCRFFFIVFLICVFIWEHHQRAEADSMSNGCQRRIIGYYRGRGNRKITEAHIEKLTHIIFDGIQIRPDEQNRSCEIKCESDVFNICPISKC